MNSQDIDENNENDEYQGRSNFTKEMTTRLVELVTENYHQIHPGNDVAEGRKLSKQIWNAIAEQINSENPHNKKSVDQIMTKWANVKKTTKQKVQQSKRFYNIHKFLRCNIEKSIHNINLWEKS
jgi:hypothetical protein